MDALNIKALSVATRIGVHAWEQQINQQLLIDIIIPSDFSTCQDNIANTIDYDALCQKVTQFVESQSFQLIESVADQVAHLIKQEFNVSQITVAVSKPHAVKNAGTIQVVVNR
ncbi:dihydroneopterin aldolase [Legionella fallonii]|uniref:7,8-dihydroneopterin aldolase n=1 Tax=Legionella fallonii LLAP-10 TaxID=1212491 RepID=A0A098G6L3_9GAMM|nr:dihydroneopterin aldolase [Legionella fallonii]CEG57609.1 putative Dihydroneopterin aldolase FolB, kinase [Legionella fallonii LLAP-10]